MGPRHVESAVEQEQSVPPMEFGNFHTLIQDTAIQDATPHSTDRCTKSHVS